jgi:DNA polymerase V
MYALVDVNNMYVSCERAFAPRLIGKPVVVLSNNDGACIARSNEAKDLGVKMAQPWFQVRHLERQAGLIALSANFELYGDMSSRMMALAGRYAPRQEVYSIDECFLDFEGVRGPLAPIGRALRAQVLQCTGLPTSVGFGPTKTLAKLANHVAKTAERKPGSYPSDLATVCNFATLPASDMDAVMAATEVGEVWGVGRQIGRQLRELGVHTVLDLARMPTAQVRQRWGVVLERTVREGSIVVTHMLPSQRSIAPQFARSPLNPFFLCDVEELILERAPQLWVHGHTHVSCDYEIGRTRVVCNPFGYARVEENARFDEGKIVDV